ncbi:hypothetical protein BDV93DRAFT_563873 [Ceratobasidium sp. AG-I]|nr:hypothetical protein BDV93DRAFT_563873 [Ceratobasidium sp. AG-I]
MGWVHVVHDNSALTGDQRALTEHVATCWDTEHDYLESHIHFKVQTQLLTANSKLKLKSYAPSDTQWTLADEMVTVLEIFKERTKRFSLVEVPLLHETLPELLEMKAELEDVCNDFVDMSPVTQVAARAALLVHEKYAKIMEESEMYYISIAMCPTLKLKWFSDNGYSQDKIDKGCAKVVDRFHTLYAAPIASAERPSHLPELGPVNGSSTVKRVNKYLNRHTHGSAHNALSA